MSSKASTGARYYAGPFDEVVLIDEDGAAHTVKWGEPAPDHFDVRRLPPDWVDAKPSRGTAASTAKKPEE